MIIQPLSQKTDAERVIEFIERFLVHPDGYNAGKPFKLAEFQKNFIEHAFGDDCNTAILSVPRKNGKTTLLVAIALAVAGLKLEKDVKFWSVVKTQSQLAFHIASKMMTPIIKQNVSFNTAKGTISLHNNDAIISFVSLDSSTTITSDEFSLFDEMGMASRIAATCWRRMIIASTKSKDADSIFASLCKEAATSPNIMLIEYSAPREMNAFGLAAWKMANPGHNWHNREIAMEMILSARDSEKKEREYRRFYLNQ